MKFVLLLCAILAAPDRILCQDLPVPGERVMQFDSGILVAMADYASRHPAEAEARGVPVEEIALARTVAGFGSLLFAAARAPLWNPLVLNEVAAATGLHVSRGADLEGSTVQIHLGIPEVRGDTGVARVLFRVRIDWVAEDERGIYPSTWLYTLIGDGGEWSVLSARTTGPAYGRSPVEVPR